jgi:hypothetical protein
VAALICASLVLGPSASASASTCSVVDPGCVAYELINGWYPNISDGTPYCLGVVGRSSAAGTLTDMQGCDGYADQEWALNNLSDENFYRIENNDDLCLEPQNRSSSEGAYIVAATCDSIANDPYEYWEVVADTDPLSDGFQTEYFDNYQTGYVIGVAGGNVNVDVNGAKVVQWAYQNLCNNQYWTFAATPYTSAPITHTCDSD